MRLIREILIKLTICLLSLFVIVGAANANTSFRVSTATSGNKTNHNQVCVSEFGTGWEEADWTDLESYYSGGGNMSDLISSSGFNERNNAWVTRNGVQSYSSTRDYFASYHNHSKPSGYLAHDNIDNYFLSLGSWYSSYYVLCKKEGDATPPPNTGKVSIGSVLNVLLAGGTKVVRTRDAYGNVVKLTSSGTSSGGKVFTTLTKKSDGKVEVKSEIISSDNKELTLEFYTSTPSIIQNGSKNDLKISIEKSPNNHIITIPKRLMQSWSNSGVHLSSHGKDIDTNIIVIIDDDPMFSWSTGLMPNE